MQATGKFKDKLGSQKMETGKKKKAPSVQCSLMIVSVSGGGGGVLFIAVSIAKIVHRASSSSNR